MFITRMAVVAGFIVPCAGCSSEAVPPADPPPVRSELLEEVSFAIDGRDAVAEELTLVASIDYHVTASYTRRDDTDVDWDTILLLLMEDDTSERIGGIRLKRVLGMREDEEPMPDGRQFWECRLLDGTVGKTCRFPSTAGRYELRLCWARQPRSVAELAAMGEDPLPFMTPFYRAYVTIRVPDGD